MLYLRQITGHAPPQIIGNLIIDAADGPAWLTAHFCGIATAALPDQE